MIIKREYELISSSADKSIQVWNLETFDRIKTLDDHDDEVHAIVMTKNGKLISGSFDATIKVFFKII